jgi:hypothetical protein
MANADREIGLETFSRIVESIYDCAFDPGRWDGAVRSIAELSGSQLSLLAVHDYALGTASLPAASAMKSASSVCTKKNTRR